MKISSLGEACTHGPRLTYNVCDAEGLLGLWIKRVAPICNPDAGPVEGPTTTAGLSLSSQLRLRAYHRTCTRPPPICRRERTSCLKLHPLTASAQQRRTQARLLNLDKRTGSDGVTLGRRCGLELRGGRRQGTTSGPQGWRCAPSPRGSSLDRLPPAPVRAFQVTRTDCGRAAPITGRACGAVERQFLFERVSYGVVHILSIGVTE